MSNIFGGGFSGSSSITFSGNNVFTGSNTFSVTTNFTGPITISTSQGAAALSVVQSGGANIDIITTNQRFFNDGIIDVSHAGNQSYIEGISNNILSINFSDIANRYTNFIYRHKHRQSRGDF